MTYQTIPCHTRPYYTIAYIDTLLHATTRLCNYSDYIVSLGPLVSPPEYSWVPHWGALRESPLWGTQGDSQSRGTHNQSASFQTWKKRYKYRQMPLLWHFVFRNFKIGWWLVCCVCVLSKQNKSRSTLSASQYVSRDIFETYFLNTSLHRHTHPSIQ